METSQLPGPGAGGPPRRQNMIINRRSKIVVSTLVWLILTAIAVAVISSMVLILVLVLLLQPHSPFVTVQSASLDTIRYNNEMGTLALRMPLLLEANNPNQHSAATFSEMEVRVSFGDTTVAVLRAPEQVHLAARGAQQLPFVASAQGATLGHVGRDTMRSAVRDHVVPFQLNGEAMVRWKFSVVTIKQWTRFNCEIKFSGSDGTPLPFYCSSKNNNKFL